MASLQCLANRMVIEDDVDYEKLVALTRQTIWAQDPDSAAVFLHAMKLEDAETHSRLPLAPNARQSWVSGDVHKYLAADETVKNVLGMYFQMDGDTTGILQDIVIDPGWLCFEFPSLNLMVTTQKYYQVFMHARKVREMLAPVLHEAPADLIAKHLVNEDLFSQLATKFITGLKETSTYFQHGIDIKVDLPIPVPSVLKLDGHSDPKSRNAAATSDISPFFFLEGIDYEASHAKHTPFGAKICDEIKTICERSGYAFLDDGMEEEEEELEEEEVL